MSDDKSSPPPSASSSSPPKREPFFQTVRRISDYQFSTLLHSLIGLPSSLSPPATSGWILDDDDIDPADAPRPRTQRSGSDSIVDEVRKLRDDEERKGGGGDGSGSGGLGIGRAETGGTSAPAPGSGKREACMGVGEIFSVPSSVEMLRGFEELHRELFRPLVMSPSSLRPENRRNNIETELDYYAFFERQFQRRNPTATATTEDGKKCVVEKFEESRG